MAKPKPHEAINTRLVDATKNRKNTSYSFMRFYFCRLVEDGSEHMQDYAAIGIWILKVKM